MMNRQQFIAELSQYLTFFSPEEKAEVISAYNEKFDSAGPECEASVIAELGTPMMTAIDLKRRMEAGEKLDLGGKPDSCEEPGQSESQSGTGAEAEESPESEDGGITGEALDEAEPECAAETEERPKARPKGAKFAFALIGAIIVSVIVAAVFLTIGTAGAGLFAAAWYLIMTGLKSLVYVLDALLLFGGGLVCAGFGLIIVWFALWSAISLIGGLFRGAYRAGIPAAGRE